MKLYHLHFDQNIPLDIKAAWDFFSTPKNLTKITPSAMNFIITSNSDEKQFIYPGTIITYKVTPLLGITVNWVTEITYLEKLKYFIDEQRFGPYSFWQHQHHFMEIENGVSIRDELYYALPLGFLGRLSNKLFVEKEIKKIFEFRRIKIAEMFGEMIN